MADLKLINQCYRDDPELLKLDTAELLEELRIYRNASSKIVTESALADIKRNADLVSKKLKAKYNETIKVLWPNDYIPFFTAMEVDNYFIKHEAERREMMHDPTHKPTKNDKIEDLRNQLRNTNDEEEVKAIKDKLIALGDNPEIDRNESVFLGRIISKYEKFIREGFYIFDKREYTARVDKYHTRIIDNPKYPSMFITVSENSYAYASVGYIREENPLRLDEVIDVYAVQLCSTLEADVELKYTFDSITDYGYYLPSNICAALIANKYIKEHAGCVTRPILNLLYSGPSDKCNRKHLVDFMKERSFID